MKVIKLKHPYDPSIIPNEPVVLALGFFDGLHRGHQRVIKTGLTIAKRKGIKLALMSFDRHPAIVFQNVDEHKIRYISPEQRKLELLADNHVDIYYEVAFTKEFAHLKPVEFVSQYIVALHADTVVAGFDYTYGPKEIANMPLLPKYADNRFDIVTIPEERLLNGKISSTRIREFLNDGDMANANRMLGYPYELVGKVIHGDHRGHLLGFPTANMELDPKAIIPREGVYAVTVLVKGQWYGGVASIGRNTTFERGREQTVEIYIIDFSKMIYGKVIRVQFLNYLRSQVAFETADDLIAQMHQDERDATAFLKEQANY